MPYGHTEHSINAIKVIPHKAKYDNLESFEAFKATKEQIWAFEARVFADQLALCTALAKKMNETAETELSEHGKWREGIKQLLPKLVEAANDSKGLCDLVGDTIQQPTSK